MYYILRFKVQNNDYYAEKPDIGKLAAPILFNGIRYNIPDLQISLSGTGGTLSDYIGNPFGLDIVSQEIKDFFVEFGKDFVECYPVTVKRKTDKKFWFIHVLDNLDCFDFEKSLYEELSPGTKIMKTIDRLALKQECTNGRHFFRVKDFRFVVVVSEAFKQAAESKNIEIMEFTPIADFTYEAGRLNSF